MNLPNEIKYNILKNLSMQGWKDYSEAEENIVDDYFWLKLKQQPDFELPKLCKMKWKEAVVNIEKDFTIIMRSLPNYETFKAYTSKEQNEIVDWCLENGANPLYILKNDGPQHMLVREKFYFILPL